ncbi:MAG TPA: thioredoxin family protein [Steroidobacteraceae bacterium]|jgi:thiol:disulfide interchange protein|nr:thioredoxin family protein [Steroidobacteraceae bacterium]
MGIAAGMARATVTAVGLALVGAWSVRAAQPDIYPSSSRAHADLTAALAAAAASHKRVIVDFGGNWCTDCHVLDLYFHDAANRPLLDAGYVLVHVNIGRRDENLDIAARYRIPLGKGVPALALLDEHGKLLLSQKGGEFEDMRHMSSASVTEFLTHWKPPTS